MDDKLTELLQKLKDEQMTQENIPTLEECVERAASLHVPAASCLGMSEMNWTARWMNPFLGHLTDLTEEGDLIWQKMEIEEPMIETHSSGLLPADCLRDSYYVDLPVFQTGMYLVRYNCGGKDIIELTTLDDRLLCASHDEDGKKNLCCHSLVRLLRTVNSALLYHPDPITAFLREKLQETADDMVEWISDPFLYTFGKDQWEDDGLNCFTSGFSGISFSPENIQFSLYCDDAEPVYVFQLFNPVSYAQYVECYVVYEGSLFPLCDNSGNYRQIVNRLLRDAKRASGLSVPGLSYKQINDLEKRLDELNGDEDEYLFTDENGFLIDTLAEPF